METGGLFSHEELTRREGYVVYRFSGKGAKRAFAQEAGGHRWQGESKGRTHSSTVTVAVLAEPTRSELRIPDKDLRIEAYRDSGPGGQNKNKNDTAIRVTHLPTGITACSTLKSQARNKELALSELRARLAKRQEEGDTSRRNAKRRNQIGRGERSDKVRTIAEQRQRVENHLNGKRMSVKRYLRGFIDEVLSD